MKGLEVRGEPIPIVIANYMENLYKFFVTATDSYEDTYRGRPHSCESREVAGYMSKKSSLIY